MVDLNHPGLKPRNQSSWQGTRLQEREDMEEPGGKESDKGREMGVRLMGIRDKQKDGQVHRIEGCSW